MNFAFVLDIHITNVLQLILFLPSDSLWYFKAVEGDHLLNPQLIFIWASDGLQVIGTFDRWAVFANEFINNVVSSVSLVVFSYLAKCFAYLKHIV